MCTDILFNQTEKICIKLKRKRTEKMAEVIKVINELEIGNWTKLEAINSEANNIKNYISKNREILRPDLGKIHVVYRRDEKSLYIYRN